LQLPHTSFGLYIYQNAFAAATRLQTHFGICRAQRTCLVAANITLLPAGGGANSASYNPLAGFEGLLRGAGGERGKGKGGENKHLPNKFLVMALRLMPTFDPTLATKSIGQRGGGRPILPIQYLCIVDRPFYCLGRRLAAATQQLHSLSMCVVVFVAFYTRIEI